MDNKHLVEHRRLVAIESYKSASICVNLRQKKITKMSVKIPFNQNQFRKALLKWYRANKRDLPWRKTKDPYKILVSEIMLQQTQVDTVVPYFQKWTKKFRTLKGLASAPSDEVMMLWEGLGYYSRARNLHHAAREIVKIHNGKLPHSYEALQKLPGIGKYTAGAVASIAFNEPVPAIDANVRRVLSRLFSLSPSLSIDKNYWKIARTLMASAPPSEFNQAMMEIGALICTARSFHCGLCPVRSFCKAFSKNAQTRYPAKKIFRKTEEVEAVLGIVINNGTVYIQKRPPQGLFAGLWEFPGGKIEKGEIPEKALCRELKEELGVKVNIIQRKETIRYSYTRFKVALHPFLCSSRKKFAPKTGERDFLWIPKSKLKNYAFPAANRKIITRLMEEKLQ